MVPSEESRIRLFCIQYWGAMFPSHGHVILERHMESFLIEWVEEVKGITDDCFDEDDIVLAFEYTLMRYLGQIMSD